MMAMVVNDMDSAFVCSVRLLRKSVQSDGLDPSCRSWGLKGGGESTPGSRSLETTLLEELKLHSLAAITLPLLC